MRRAVRSFPATSVSSARVLLHAQYRRFSPQSEPVHFQRDDPEPPILVDGKSNSRMVYLNRPSALNSLTTAMTSKIKKLYESWEDNIAIGFIMLKGHGRAFCSGSDAVKLYHLLNEGKLEECKNYFRSLYGLVYLLGTYLKPHVAIFNGIAMGAGAGISLPGTFRVATDKTIFATPEVRLGFHPDAGASFYLSRLPGYLGEYLGLTGDKLNGAEMISCGLATHYTLNARLVLVEERLGKLNTDVPSIIDTSLANYGDLVYPDKTSVVHRIETIDKCFSHDTVEEIMLSLEEEARGSQREWCLSVLSKLQESSPLSLKVTLHSIREGRFQPLDTCLQQEYRVSVNWISRQASSQAFCEGIRACLVEKDFNPKWCISSLEEVTKEMVDCFFEPLDEHEPELELPVALREPSV